MGMTMNNDTTTPEFNGDCAFAVSVGKLDVPGAPKHSAVEDGKTYYFKNPVARFLWKVLPDRTAKADEVWAERSSA